MSDELNEIFAECIEAVEEGRLTVSQCLAQYPQYRAELSDLLQVATEMREIPPVRPTQEMRQRTQERLLATLPVRVPANNGETLSGQAGSRRQEVAGLAAVFLPLLAWLKKIPQKLAQQWPAAAHPAFAIGMSVVGAVVLLLGAGMMTAVGASFLSGLQERSIAVSIEDAQGIVEVLGADGRWTPVNKGATLSTEYRVRTGDNSGATLVFADGQIASLGPNSEVNLNQLARGGVAFGGTVTGTVTITPTKTITPTPTMTPTETITPTPTMTPTATVGGMVTICHKPGTPAEQTKTIPMAALGGHLGHGDVVGACDNVPTPTVSPTVTLTPTITPTGTITPTVTMTPTETVNPTGTPETFVTICHKPGTPAEQTKTIPQSALNGHLGHGDTLGPCTEDTPEPPPTVPGPTPTSPGPSPTPPPPSGGGNVTICHKPGTPAQKTMVVSQSALNGHLNHGDTLGPCN